MVTSCERELAAIRHQVPDRIPVDTMGIDDTDGVNQCLRSSQAQYQGKTMEDLYQELGIDGRMGTLNYAGPPCFDPQGNPVSEWGCAIGNLHAARFYPLAQVETIGEIERYPWPDPAAYDYTGMLHWAQACAANGSAVRVRYWHPFFVRAMDLLGMERLMMMMALEPALYEAMLEKIFEVNDGVFRRMLEVLGPVVPIFGYGDDFATQRGLMISPEMWRKYFKRPWQRLFEVCHQAGKIVWFHSCGDITPLLPDLIEIGMDVWETVQLDTLSVAPQTLKREYGAHLTFFGGISTQRLPFATPVEVADEVRRCIDALGHNGGYICGADHHIRPDVPPENVLRLFQTATAYRQAGYTHRAR